jgi:hypothetical protein
MIRSLQFHHDKKVKSEVRQKDKKGEIEIFSSTLLTLSEDLLLSTPTRKRHPIQHLELQTSPLLSYIPRGFAGFCLFCFGDTRVEQNRCQQKEKS